MWRLFERFNAWISCENKIVANNVHIANNNSTKVFTMYGNNIALATCFATNFLQKLHKQTFYCYLLHQISTLWLHVSMLAPNIHNFYVFMTLPTILVNWNWFLPNVKFLIMHFWHHVLVESKCGPIKPSIAVMWPLKIYIFYVPAAIVII